MKTSDIQSRLTRGYLEIMKNLSIQSKLYHLLVNRIDEVGYSKKQVKLSKTFGAWNKTESADDNTRSIIASRRLNSQTEEL